MNENAEFGTVAPFQYKAESKIFTVAVLIDGEPAVFGTDIDPRFKGGKGLIVAANEHAEAVTNWGADIAPGSPAFRRFVLPEFVDGVLDCQGLDPRT